MYCNDRNRVSKLCLIPLFGCQQWFPASHRVNCSPRIYTSGGAHKHTHARKHARSFTLSTAAQAIWVCCVYMKWVPVSVVWGDSRTRQALTLHVGGGASRGQATFKFEVAVSIRVVDKIKCCGECKRHLQTYLQPKPKVLNAVVLVGDCKYLTYIHICICT